jgi:hypothetical protein
MDSVVNSLLMLRRFHLLSLGCIEKWYIMELEIGIIVIIVKNCYDCYSNGIDRVLSSKEHLMLLLKLILNFSIDNSFGK